MASWKSRLVSMWAEVSHRIHPGGALTLHHIWGRRGKRLLACQRFIVPATLDVHEGPKYGAWTARLRDKNRCALHACEAANKGNRDGASCLWRSCEFSDVCPLAKAVENETETA